MTARNLGYEAEEIAGQLTRYSSLYNEELADVLWKLTDINDDLHNMRDPDLIQAAIDKAKSLLDKVSSKI